MGFQPGRARQFLVSLEALFICQALIYPGLLASSQGSLSLNGSKSSWGEAAVNHRSLQVDDSLLSDTPNSRLHHSLDNLMTMEQTERESEQSQKVTVGKNKGTQGGEGGDGIQRTCPGNFGPKETPEMRRAQLQRILSPLSHFPKFNLSSPKVAKFAELVDASLAPWKPVEGVTEGVGKRGMVSSTTLASMGNKPGFMSSCGHVRVVKGKIFFRWGGFMRKWYTVRRYVYTLKAIQAAIEHYSLHSLNAEFLLSMSDQPISFDSAMATFRAGYPLFGTEWRPGSTEILFPDPLDLSESYMTHAESKVPWEKRKSKAIFRGATTNYDFHLDFNWRASPRIRVHRMSDVRPDLLDARISRWSHVEGQPNVDLIIGDGFKLGKHTTREELEHFKYELVLDGGGGSSRVCGVLSSKRVMIRQESSYSQFFQPLLEPYVHYIPTKHYLEDLYSKVEWARENEELSRAMVAKANKVARWACTRRGRELYWAILLVKYSKEAMESPESVEEPTEVCHHKFDGNLMYPDHTRAEHDKRLPVGWPPKTCFGAPIKEIVQPTCTMFCLKGTMKELPKYWVTMEALDHIEWAYFDANST